MSALWFIYDLYGMIPVHILSGLVCLVHVKQEDAGIIESLK
jgi:hypothetical protein